MLSRIVAVWAAIGVTLTGATQLRLAGQPIGPGELLLVLWAAFVGFCLLRGVRFAYTDAFKFFLTFWLVSALLLSLGSLVAIQINRLDDRAAGHDTQAFIFIGVLTCMLAIRLGNDDKYYLTMVRATFFTVTATGLALLVAGLVTPHLGPISLWYYGVRFRGWSENPNQLALFLVAMPFFGWYLLQQTRGPVRKLGYVLAILICTAVCVATESDSSRVSWVGAIGAIFASLLFRSVFRGRGKFLYISHLLLPAVAIVTAVAAGTYIAGHLADIAGRVYEEGGQGSDRITRWLNGLDAMLHSPLVGLGPGAHSGVSRAFEGQEAHNTFVDWGTSTGLTGVLLLLSLLFWCVWRTLRAQELALLGVVVTVMIDSLFGYSMRQPIYWLLLLLVVTLTEQPARVKISLARPLRDDLLRAPERPA